MSSTQRSSRDVSFAGTDVLLAFRGDVEGQGYTDLGLVEVGDVEDEGQFVAGVDEAECRAAGE